MPGLKGIFHMISGKFIRDEARALSTTSTCNALLVCMFYARHGALHSLATNIMHARISAGP